MFSPDAYLHVENQGDLLHHVVVQDASDQDFWTVDVLQAEIFVLGGREDGKE